MPRSPRTQRLLLGGFAILLVVTGTAFVSTFGTQLTWQQRDGVTAAPTGYELVADGDRAPAVRVAVRVENPLDRPIELSGGSLVVYDGARPFADGQQLTDAAGASIPRVTVPSGGERTVTATAELRSNSSERARTAVERGTATASGVVEVTLGGREFTVDV